MKKLLLAVVLASSFFAQSALAKANADCGKTANVDKENKTASATNPYYQGAKTEDKSQQKERVVRSDSNQGAT